MTHKTTQEDPVEVLSNERKEVMGWRGLTQESKHFCGYWNKTPAGKARWWIAYLFSAAPRFWFYQWRYAIDQDMKGKV